MIPDDFRKLLGGYATGTLTDEERNLLFSAALQDQELFDALADEEALRELLAEPATRQTLLEQLQRQPVLDASLLRDRQAPLNLATQASAPLPRPVFAEPPRGRYHLTPSRLAVAALALLLVVAGGIQYKRLHSPEPTTVASVAMDRTAALRVESQAPMVPRSTAAAPVVPRKSAPQAADAGISKAVELDRATQRNEENRATAPPAIPSEADSEKRKVEKETADTAQARDQLNQAVRDQLARQQSTPAESATAASSGKVSERQSVPISPSQIVTGGLRPAAVPLPPPPPPPAARAMGIESREFDAKVTDINGTIVSINAGSNAGLRAGDVVEIIRDKRVIATSKLSQVGVTFAVGPLRRTGGSADIPQTGDAVRRAR